LQLTKMMLASSSSNFDLATTTKSAIIKVDHLSDSDPLQRLEVRQPITGKTEMNFARSTSLGSNDSSSHGIPKCSSDKAMSENQECSSPSQFHQMRNTRDQKNTSPPCFQYLQASASPQHPTEKITSSTFVGEIEPIELQPKGKDAGNDLSKS
jgi:hypothetical protein